MAIYREYNFAEFTDLDFAMEQSFVFDESMIGKVVRWEKNKAVANVVIDGEIDGEYREAIITGGHNWHLFAREFKWATFA
jgi:hypothetical protein